MRLVFAMCCRVEILLAEETGGQGQAKEAAQEERRRRTDERKEKYDEPSASVLLISYCPPLAGPRTHCS